MPTTLAKISVGSIVKLNVSGNPTNFLVVHQGKPSDLYDDSCNGTWLLMQDIYSKMMWDPQKADYKISDVHEWLSNEFPLVLDDDIVKSVKQVRLPIYNLPSEDAVSSGADGLRCKFFLLSAYELGWTKSDYDNVEEYIPEDGAKLDYFLSGTDTEASNKRIAEYDGSADIWWTRTPPRDDIGNVIIGVNTAGEILISWRWSEYGVRPAFVLPDTLFVEDDGTVVAYSGDGIKLIPCIKY